MARKLAFFLCLMSASVLFSAGDSSAAIYQYTGKDGLVTLTDDLQAIPPEYRTSAEIVSGEAKQETPSSPPSQGKSAEHGTTEGSGDSAEMPGQNPDRNSSPGRRALTSAAVAVSAVFAFFIIGAVDTENKKVKNVARIVLLWAVALYLLFAHAPDIADLFSHAGNSVRDVRQRAEERGKKASRAVKSLNTLIGNGEGTAGSEDGTRN